MAHGPGQNFEDEAVISGDVVCFDDLRCGGEQVVERLVVAGGVSKLLVLECPVVIMRPQ
jgi:hypothetical protein